jgi:hypothetical protein
MAESISPAEQKIVERLKENGFPAIDAMCAVLVATRAYSRPIGDLIETFRHYPGLEDRDSLERALESLISRGWMVRDPDRGIIFVAQVPDLREKVATTIDDESISEELLKLRRLNDDYARLIGPLRDKYAYLSYLDLLRTAQSHIYFAIVVTSPNDLGSIPILQDRARRGVRVKVLAATPHLAGEIRSAIMEPEMRQRLKAWQQVRKGIGTFRIRVTGRKSDLRLATSLAVDSRVLRLVAYDFERERSKEGLVVEFSSPGSATLNVISQFEEQFEAAWKRARPLGVIGAALWYARQFWQFWLGVIFLVLTFLIQDSDSITKFFGLSSNDVAVAVAVSGAIAGSFLFSWLVEIVPRLRQRIFSS